MASLIRHMIRGSRVEEPESRAITTIDDYVTALAQQFAYAGNTYGLSGVQTTWNDGTDPREDVTNNVESYAQAMYSANGVIFACLAVRQLVFSAVRFQFQRLRNGRPSDLFGSGALSVLETPWPGGTTQDLLARQILDVDICGNSFFIEDTPMVRLGTEDGTELVRLRPDWCQFVLIPRMIRGEQVGWRKQGLAYYEGGKLQNPDAAVVFVPEDVVHFAPYPDPLASFRGMSPLTPIVREVRADKMMTRHREKFFENAATPNLAVRMDPAVSYEMFLKFKEQMDALHSGVENAYRTLYFGAAADITVVGQNFEQMSFKAVQGAGETRIAAALGVPPVIVGLSEGLASATYSNYSQARRRLADGTMHPLWANVAGSLGTVVRAPGIGTRLWYDARDVPFLREDEADAANIAATRATTIRTYVDSGYTPESAVAAVDSGDLGLLVHSGLYSVQLQALPNPNATVIEERDEAEPTDADRAREVAELLQKMYLATGVVITKEEARLILNRVGAGLAQGVPPELVPEPEPVEMLEQVSDPVDPIASIVQAVSAARNGTGGAVMSMAEGRAMLKAAGLPISDEIPPELMPMEDEPDPVPEVDPTAPTVDEARVSRIAALLAQLTTSTGKVITPEEARLIANLIGAGLEIPAPDDLAPASPVPPVDDEPPADDSDSDDSETPDEDGGNGGGTDA